MGDNGERSRQNWNLVTSNCPAIAVELAKVIANGINIHYNLPGLGRETTTVTINGNVYIVSKLFAFTKMLGIFFRN